MSASLRIAVIGAGHLGGFHARALNRLVPGQPMWIVDREMDPAQELAREVGARAGTELAPVLQRASAVIIAAPTESHFEIASRALRSACHVLVEKPMTERTAQGEALVRLAAKCNRKLQVGHIERFNPVFRAARNSIGIPAFMESQRLAPFVPRSLDIDVVLDLMIHDIDILLSLVPDPVVSLDAVGVSVLTQNEDIANAWLRFENGTVANLTASRVSPEKVRKLRFFGQAGYVSLDFLTHRGHRASVHADPSAAVTVPGSGRVAVTVPGSGRVQVDQEALEVPSGDALSEEIRDFLHAIREDRPPLVSGEDGLRVLRLASRIRHEVRRSLEQFRDGGLRCSTGRGMEKEISPALER
ncbi:MAG: Gfo/Idh/MocA family oxidoreductase [Candidatus Eisenbacteria sp.]|nr:Gfo/Idh/MocA family oxidoreductase [Candidatus Eisenbacteria bacterium]